MQNGLNLTHGMRNKLQAQIKVALSQVSRMAQRIQDLMRQNEELRHEVATLKQQLVHRLTAQAV